jgi:ketosteroid isomerase-like protein
MPGFELKWQATGVQVAEAGDMGYTVGTYELAVEQDGASIVTVGKYVTLWQKQADGSWKVIVDCFNADGPPTNS